MTNLDKFKNALESYDAALASMAAVRIAEESLRQQRIQAQCRIDETRQRVFEVYALGKDT